MKKWKREWKRIMAIALALLLAGTSVDMSAFAVHAAEVTQESFVETHTECGDSCEHTANAVGKEKETVYETVSEEASLEETDASSEEETLEEPDTSTEETTQEMSVEESVYAFTEDMSDDAEEGQTFANSVVPYAESADVVSYPVYVQGIQVTDVNAADVLGDADEGASVTYDAATATLTLKDADITPVTMETLGSSSYYGIYAEQDLSLFLTGTNTIGGGGGSADRGVYLKKGVLTIAGDGELTMEDEICYGIASMEGVTINSGTIYVDADIAGICSDGAIVINGGTINAKGERGIHANSGGTVTITGGRVTASGSIRAISGTGGITITGGTVTAEGSYGGSIFTFGRMVFGGDAHVKATNTAADLAIEGEVYQLAEGSLGHYRTEADGTFAFAENISCDSSYFEFVGGDHMTVTTTDENHALTCEEGCVHAVSFTENHLGGTATHIRQADCTVCGIAYGTTDENGHYGGTATCTQQAVCEYEGCGQPYGELLPHVTNPTTGKCRGCDMDMATTTVTAEGFLHYAGTPADLKASVEAAIRTGHTDITVTLPADADAYWITPVRNGILASGATDGSIHLTLAGITEIPGHDEFDPAKAIFGEILVDADGISLAEDEIVTQLGTVSLPDVTSIGSYAFSYCENLKTLYAPKVQMVDTRAFCGTGLVSLELPEATTLEYASFLGCESLTSARLPKATSLGDFAFDNTALTYLELLAEETISIHEYALGYPETLAGQVDLVLNCNKKEEVTDGVRWKGFMFKSVTRHKYTYMTQENTIEAVCVGCDNTGSVTLVDPDGDGKLLTYNGQPQGTTFTGSIDGVTPVIHYTGTEYSGAAYDSEVAPVNAGTYMATMTLGEGETAAYVSVEFEIQKASPVIEIESDKVSCEKRIHDDDFPLEGITYTGDGTLTYEVSDGKDLDGEAKTAGSILIVSEDGIASIQGFGSVTVSVSAEATGNCYAAEPQAVSVTVATVDEFFVDEPEEMTYTGKAIKPTLTVYDGLTGALVKSKDYTVTYKNNTNAYTLKEGDEGFDATKAPQAIVKGKGNYSSKLTVYFTIQPKDLSDMEDESIVAKEFLSEANGKVQKKVPAITYNGKKLAGVLKPADGSAPGKVKDFVYSYPQLAEDATKDSAFKDAGTWQILVEGTGNYTGSRYVNVIIAAKGGKMTSARVKSIPAQEYTGEAIYLDAEALKVTAKINGRTETLVRGTHYDVSYKNNTNIGTATVTLTGIPEAGFSGSKTVTFKIVGTSIAKATVEGIEAKIYNGNAQTQDLTVTLSKKVKTENGTETQMSTLIKDKDFTVTYDKNVNAGTARMTIKGIGAYTGTIKKTFKITAYDMTGETDAAGNVKEDSALKEANGLFTMKNGELSVKFVKGGAKPAVKLLFNGRALTEGADYTVAYKNNKSVYTLVEGMDGYKAGKAPTLTIKGKGNFKGSVSKTFVITGRDLQDAELGVTMTVNDKAVSNKKGGYISKPVLTDADGKVLKQGKDYTAPVYTMTGENGETVTLTKNDKVTEPGTVITVTVYGIGAYTGSAAVSAGSPVDAEEPLDSGSAQESVLAGTYRITAQNFGQVKVQPIKKEYTGRKVVLTEEDFYDVDDEGNRISKVTMGSSKNKVELKYGVDFEIVPGSYKNNVKKGTASVTLRGISDTTDGGSGLYGGTKTIKFQVGTRGLRGWFWWLGF